MVRKSIIAALSVIFVSALVFTHGNHIEAQSSIPYKVEKVVDNVYVPWGTAFTSHTNDNNWRMLITERNGTVQAVTRSNGNQTKQKLYDFPEVKAAQSNVNGDPIDKDREAGLLGLTLDPNYAQNKYVYMHVFWPNGNGIHNARIVRMTDTGTTLNNRVDIVTGIPGDIFHRGGRLQFGPDGYLYITTGDAAQMVGKSVEELHPLDSYPQDINSLGGKILRVKANGDAAPGNPFIGKDGDDRIFSYGYRSLVGMDFDPTSGQLVTVGHGPTSGEKKYLVDGQGLSNVGGDEVNVNVLGGNYGWPMMVGNDKSTFATQYESSTGINLRGPAFVDYTPPGGATFYTGCVFPQFKNHYLYTGLKDQGIYDVDFGSSLITSPKRTKLSGISVGRIRDIIEGPDGYVYFSTSNDDGIDDGPNPGGNSIYRLIPQGDPNGACTGNPTPTTVPPTPIPTGATGVIPSTSFTEQGTVYTSNDYVWGTIAAGETVYTDSNVTYTNVPSILQGATVLKTANEDKSYPTGQRLLEFRSKDDLRVYVIYSSTDAEPTDGWLNEINGWIPADFSVSTDNPDAPTMLVRYTDVSFDQRATFNGNGGFSEQASNYTVVVTKQFFPDTGIVPATSLTEEGEVYSGKNYTVDTLGVGVNLYTDESFKYTQVPSELEDAVVIQTANGDKRFSGGERLMQFRTKDDVRVYVIYSGTDAEPTDGWLSEANGWASAELSVRTDNPNAEIMLVRYKDVSFDQGVEFNGNGGFTDNASNYTVAVKKMGTDECPKRSLGDLDCSGKVNALDLTILLGRFGSNDSEADLDDSGVVNALDLTILLTNFGS